MKKLLSVLMLCVLVFTPVFAQGIKEQNKIKANEITEINFAVLAGPTGMGAAQLSQNDGMISDDLKVNMRVFSAVSDVTVEILKGEEDVAAISTNLAAILFNKGINIKIAATICDGMMYVLSSEVEDVSQLIGKKLSLAGGPLGTPKYLTDIILDANGYNDDDIECDYGVKSAQQLASLVIAGKIKHAILTEPFATVVCKKNPNVKKIYSLQEGYKDATGLENYPMAVLVVKDEFAQEHPSELKSFMNSYKKSVSFVVNNPEASGKLIEDCGIMKKEMAVPSIPNCNLTFKTGSMDEINSYYERMYDFNVNSIGGSVPTKDFYL